MNGQNPQRLAYSTVAPGALASLYAARKYLHGTSLGLGLLHLVDLRASQMNGCAFCINMHTIEARDAGEREERLHGLLAWREAGWYSDRERAALLWTEALTAIADGHAPDEVYGVVSQQFSEKELVDLTLAVTTINAWNRFSIAFRTPPESAPAVVRAMAAAG